MPFSKFAESLRTMCRCRWLCWVQCCIGSRTDRDQQNNDDSIKDFLIAYQKSSSSDSSHNNNADLQSLKDEQKNPFEKFPNFETPKSENTNPFEHH